LNETTTEVETTTGIRNETTTEPRTEITTSITAETRTEQTTEPRNETMETSTEMTLETTSATTPEISCAIIRCTGVGQVCHPEKKQCVCDQFNHWTQVEGQDNQIKCQIKP